MAKKPKPKMSDQPVIKPKVPILPDATYNVETIPAVFGVDREAVQDALDQGMKCAQFGGQIFVKGVDFIAWMFAPGQRWDPHGSRKPDPPEYVELLRRRAQLAIPKVLTRAEVAAEGLVSQPIACEFLACKKSMLYRLMDRGQIGFAMIGRRRAIPVVELRRYVGENLHVPNLVE